MKDSSADRQFHSLITTTNLRWIGIALTLAACAGAPADNAPAPDVGPGDETTALPPSPGGIPDGTHGWARVRTPHGIERLTYVAYNNHAMHEGDVDLGPISLVDERLRGGALTSTGARWPHEINYGFNANVPGVHRDTVGVALDELAAKLPIHFNDVTTVSHSGPWIEFKMAHIDSAGVSTAIGMVGCGVHTTSIGPEIRSDCGQWIFFDDDRTLTKHTVKHEVLHALGLWHEQSRNDRDTFVDYNPQCLVANADQYEKKSDSEDLGPYDYKSIMHYPSDLNCFKDPVTQTCPCRPITKWADNDKDGLRDPIAPSADLTREDVNTLWQAYNRPIGVNSEGDEFGKALAVGDFDGDGYDDVAVGIPGNDGVAEGGGAVIVWKGTALGLVPWHVLAESSAPGHATAGGDHYGAALAAGDIDGDKMAELLVGVPDREVGGVSNAGEVHVFRGSVGGPHFDHIVDAVDGGGTIVSGARFGAAIAIGKLANHGSPEMVIGAPGDRGTGATKSGAVYVLHEDPEELFSVQPTRLALAGTAGDSFGAAIAIGKIDGGNNVDLAIGAPGNGGRVHVFAGRTPPEIDTAQWSAMATFRQSLTSPLGGSTDRFGGALLIANVSGTPTGEIVVGSPGANDSAGRVYVFNLAAPDLAAAAPMVLAQTLLSNGNHDAGDEFGAALTAFQRDPATPQLELVVGSPGEHSNAGVITLYRGDATVTQPTNVWQSADVFESSEPGDRFGAALATGQIDGLGGGVSSDDFENKTQFLSDLVVGSPGERLSAYGNVAAGEIALFIQLPGQMFPLPAYDQHSSIAQ